MFSSIYDLHTLDVWFLFFFVFFVFGCPAWCPAPHGALPRMILVTEPGPESTAVAVNVWGSNHCTNRDVSIQTRC